MDLAGLTWPEASERAPAAMLAVPVGATEQHGPHLPLSTDTDIAVELCQRLSRRRPDVLPAPPLHYGSSGEHAAFAGTISIGSQVLEALVVELGRSADSFSGVLFVSTHGGNAEPIERARRRLVAEGRRVRVWHPPATGDAHAGHTETSVLLATRPETVRAGQAEAGCREPLAAILPAMRRGGVGAVSPNGVLGDPTGASAAAGLRILDEWAAHLAADVEGWP